MTLEQRLAALREERAKAVADMRAIIDAAAAEGRDLTAEETELYDAFKADADKATAQIERLEDQLEIEAALEQPVPAVAQRVRPVRGPEAVTEFESVGEFLHAVTFRQNDPRLASLWSEFEPGPRAEQSMGTGTAGGFMVPTQFRETLLQVSPQEAAIRPRAQVIPAGDPPDSAVTMPALDQTNDTNAAPDNVYGGVTVNWIAEGGTKQETDADLREIRLEPKEVAGYITITDKLLRNWQAASAVLERLLRGAVVRAEEHAFLQGNGVGRPLGILNAGAAYEVNRATASQVNYADVASMIARLLMRGGSPVWLASQSVMPQLLNMRNEIGSPATGDGALIWQPSAREGEPDRLMGRPIIWHERSPTLGTKGDLSLADLSYYLIKDGSGPFVAASSHVNFTSNKTVIKIFWNVDGQPWLTEPFVQEGGFEVSPFVVLDVPSS